MLKNFKCKWQSQLWQKIGDRLTFVLRTCGKHLAKMSPPMRSQFWTKAEAWWASLYTCTRRELYWRVIGDNNEETTCAEDRSECCTITMRGRHICGSHLSVKADLQIFCSTSKSLVRYVGAENMSKWKLFVKRGFDVHFTFMLLRFWSNCWDEKLRNN